MLKACRPGMQHANIATAASNRASPIRVAGPVEFPPEKADHQPCQRDCAEEAAGLASFPLYGALAAASSRII